MTKSSLLFCVNYLILFKICHAQYSSQGQPNTPTTTNANAPLATTPAPIIELIAPKGYPEGAKAYFLPAPPSSPKITFLKPNPKDFTPNIISNYGELSQNINEVPLPSSSTLPNQMSSRVALPPAPPPCETGLPDLLDEIPSLIQDKFIHIPESKKSIICESCAKLLKKLPIFNFDQELLDGFLNGIGI